MPCRVVLGGQWEENGGSYGMPIVAIPSKRIPDALERITTHYIEHRDKDERFTGFVQRVGKGAIRELLDDLTQDIPTHEADADFYAVVHEGGPGPRRR